VASTYNNLFLKDDNTTKQLVFESFHGDCEVNDAAQGTDLSTPSRTSLYTYQ